MTLAEDVNLEEFVMAKVGVGGSGMYGCGRGSGWHQWVMEWVWVWVAPVGVGAWAGMLWAGPAASLAHQVTRPVLNLEGSVLAKLGGQS